MYTRLPATGRNYEIQILRSGQEVTIFEAEKVTERPIEKTVDRKPLTRGGRIVRRTHIQGYELAIEGAKVDPVMNILLGISSALNIKGEVPDPTELSVIVRVTFPNSPHIEESVYTECVISEPERSSDDLDSPINERFKITAVHKNPRVDIRAVGGLTGLPPALGGLLNRLSGIPGT
jgi:hypothetical protein